MKASEGCCDILICISGDSTWNEVISGIMEMDGKPVLAHPLSGTVNGFAVTLKPSKSTGKLMDTIARYRLFFCDIGRFNNRYSTYTAAFGIFTEISYSVSQSTKNSLRKIAYFLGGVKQLTDIPRYHVKTVIDQNEVIENFCILDCVTSSKLVVGFTIVNSRGAQLDDGQSELLPIRVLNNPLDAQNIAAALIKHEANEARMYFQKICGVHIEAREQIPWILDGGDGGNTTPAHILNKSRAVTILV